MDTPNEKLLENLGKAEVKFIVVGGLAVALNGFVRTTEDVDILVETSAANINRLLHALGSFGQGHARELSLRILKPPRAPCGWWKIFHWISSP